MPENYIAKVINNVDPDLKGKVQIYIPHKMEGMNPSHYPWVKQDKEWTSFIPEIGEYIWVYFIDETFLKKGYYKNKVTLKDYHDHNETIGSMSDVYPNIKYIKLSNGVSFALSSNLTEASIKAGNTEIYINPSGAIKMTVSPGQTITLSDGTVSFNALTHFHSTGIGPSGSPINGT